MGSRPQRLKTLRYELRAVIKYLHKKGMTPKEIHEDMVSTLGKECLAYSTVRKWVAEFKQGRTSTEDDPRSGCPKTSSSDEQVDAIHCMVLSDRRMTVQQIAKATDISVGSVHHVLTDILGMNKLSARWVPRMLTPEQMLKRVDISRTLLTRFHADPENFQRRIVTQDETWVHHFEPESKLQILMVDYLQKGQTINGEFYASELRKLKKEIKAKRRGKLRAGVLLLQDNAPVHTAQVAVAEAHNCGFELLPHPPYSPDLSHLCGRHFRNDDDVIHAVEEFLGDQDVTFFRDGIVMLEHRWTKCIAVNGDYVEK
uniref:Mos1 transposase HTH domain-containing protein n=1 Tax=Sphaeramia orbicularis TaxID=375764 RepID=A0A672ZDH7_9TELE